MVAVAPNGRPCCLITRPFRPFRRFAQESRLNRHAPWGLLRTGEFATAQETAYPFGLAFAIARAFLEAALQSGYKSPPVDLSEASMQAFVLQASRIATGVQVKASKIPPIVAEHCQIVHCFAPEPVANMQRLKADSQAVDADNHTMSIPADSQLLANHPTVTSNFKGGYCCSTP